MGEGNRLLKQGRQLLLHQPSVPCRLRVRSGGSDANDSPYGPKARSSRLSRVFNLSGSELVFLLLIALVVLGPEKLPDAMRRAGKAYSEFKKMSSGFQSEFRQAVDEPLREARETANLIRESARVEGLEELIGDVAKMTKPKSAIGRAAQAQARSTVASTQATAAAASTSEPSAAPPSAKKVTKSTAPADAFGGPVAFGGDDDSN
jgi:sec-independent protein translocase protein TatB